MRSDKISWMKSLIVNYHPITIHIVTLIHKYKFYDAIKILIIQPLSKILMNHTIKVDWSFCSNMSFDTRLLLIMFLLNEFVQVYVFMDVILFVINWQNLIVAWWLSYPSWFQSWQITNILNTHKFTINILI